MSEVRRVKLKERAAEGWKLRAFLGSWFWLSDQAFGWKRGDLSASLELRPGLSSAFWHCWGRPGKGSQASAAHWSVGTSRTRSGTVEAVAGQ